jgi:hypothetical protein
LLNYCIFEIIIKEDKALTSHKLLNKMNKPESYLVLNNFKNALLSVGFTNLPESPTEEDIVPFKAIYDTYNNLLLHALKDDMTLLNVQVNSVVENIFYPEDDRSQGAAICYNYILTEEGEDLIPVAIKYFVFQNIIHCYLHTHIPSRIIMSLRSSKNVFHKALANDYANANTSHLYNFYK